MRVWFECSGYKINAHIVLLVVTCNNIKAIVQVEWERTAAKKESMYSEYAIAKYIFHFSYLNCTFLYLSKYCRYL